MRITLVSPYAPPLVGGLEAISLMIGRHLLAAGHETGIVAQFATSRHTLRRRFVAREPSRSFQVEGVPVAIIEARWQAGLPGSIIYGAMWCRPLERHFVALAERAFRGTLDTAVAGADVVHYLGTGTEPLGFAAAAAARTAGAALVVQPAIHPGHWGDRRLDALLYQRADMVIAFTAAEAGIIRHLGVPAERIRVVPGSLDPPPPVSPNAFRVRHRIDGPLVLFVGRKTEDKGIGRLLAAWTRIRSAIPTATLVLIGPAMPDAVRGAGNADNVIDVDDASEWEKHEAIAACDVFCLPSIGESFGIASFEAMSHGKPVVVVDLPALRESVGAAGAGLLVAPTAEAIATAVLELLGNPMARAVMGDRGPAHAGGHTHERAFAGYLDGYAAALECRRE